MEIVFIKNLKSLLDAAAGQMELYTPKKSGEHYIFSRYDPSAESELEFTDIRVCSPIKEFLFPMREIAAVYPESDLSSDVKPFAVFGLKDCDLKSIDILDHVFKEEDFLDPFYVSRRENMFIISADCYNPAESCCCNLFDGRSFAEKGFDLNVSKTNDGFIIQAGSEKGSEFLQQHKQLFEDVPSDALTEPIKEIVENSQGSEVFDIEAKGCVECQACTRVCPTCHCFFLYDTKEKDYFSKMKMWDSCVRFNFTTVAGGETPRKILGERTRHRLMHKFVYFLDRYGINMCVGCGRCIDGCAGTLDMREILKRLSEELKGKKQIKAAK